MFESALLVLADGTLFEGTSIGADGETVGEVVFNTSITGYQEILTDPSYYRQIVTLTYPHIGNYGVNAENTESRGLFAAGLIIRELSLSSRHFRSEKSLREYLISNKTVGIAGIDTRKLTCLLREKGTQAGCIITGSRINKREAIEKARAFGSLAGQDLAQVVSCQQAYEWDISESSWDVEYAVKRVSKFKVVVYDFGVKHNMLRMLSERGCRLTVVPARTPASEVLAMNPDGIFLSNGPGDPEACDYAIEATRECLARKIPIFGICLGHQLLGLAVGAKTSKMKFGHHGANHPVQDLETQRVMITSQNHGFQVDEVSLPSSVRVTHRSLFDGTVQGIALKDQPALGFQGHPEASPGPHDLASLFDRFIVMMESK